MTHLQPVIRYPGSKHRIARWIVTQFPPHAAYLEPFFGSGTVMFAKPRGDSEIVNDLDGEVVNMFRVLREQPEDLARAVALTPWAREEYVQSFEREGLEPLEQARRFITYWWQAVGSRGITATGFCVDYHGKAEPARAVTWIGLPERLLAVAQRLQGVQIENRPALELIERCRHPEVLIYNDPPYLGTTRHGRLYPEEMRGSAEHESLIEALDRHPGPVVLSGYASDLYAERLTHWRRLSRKATAQKPGERIECLWLNQQAAAAQPVLPWDD